MMTRKKSFGEKKKKEYNFKREKPLVTIRKRDQVPMDDHTTTMPEVYNNLPAGVLDKILAYLSINLTKREACLRVGVAYSYFQHLCTDNVENINDMVERAKLKSKIHHLQRIHKGVKTWKASAWFLERAHRNEYASQIPEGAGKETKKQKIKIGGNEIEF